MKLTGEQVKEAMFRAAVSCCDYKEIHYDKIAEILNKWIENEPVLKPKEFDPVELLLEVLKKLDKIQEQLTSLSGENKKEMSDNEVWEMLKKLNETSKIWPHLGQDFNKCEGCPFYNKPIWSIINPCEKCQGWVWRQQNTIQTHTTTTTMPLQNHTAQINIELENIQQSPQKETQEKSCNNCNNRFNDNGEVNEECVGCVQQNRFNRTFYTNWESEPTPQEKSCATCKDGPLQQTSCETSKCYLNENRPHWQPKETPQDESCKNCSIDKYCDGYCSGFQAKDDQESR